MDGLTLVLVAVDDAMAEAWNPLAAGRTQVAVHHGSITDVDADAVVSPANSLGFMGGGIDGVYARWFPGISDRVRAASGADRGGELPVGEAVIVATGVDRPAWLISAPTMREPGEVLPPDTVHPYLAARAVFRLWHDGRLEDGRRVRQVVRTIALPGLGTGTGGVAPQTCARQVMAAWDETFDPTRP
jgi:O-acetyl-ADP-ribose deacetylase (regulator of RNase III)